jgi:hypothetical protein
MPGLQRASLLEDAKTSESGHECAPSGVPDAVTDPHRHQRPGHIVLIDPAALRWQVINDEVMGGCSNSSFTVEDGCLHFRGALSTANGGGFASIRAELCDPPAAFYGLRLSVSGDGRHYQVRLRETAHSEAIAWRALFEARAAVESVVLMPDDFEAVIRGRRVETLPGLRQRSVRHLGFMLTSKRPGPFALAVHQIETVERNA